MFPQTGMLEYRAFLPSLVQFEIWTADRVSAALAQWSYESRGLQALEESFAFTPERLLAVFPARVKSMADAERLVKRGPEAIANAVYGGRFGNRAAGDGWRFRGRGPTQLTFYDNYALAGAALNMPLTAQPDMVKLIEVGAQVAGYFWAAGGCNAFADQGNFDAITRRINGGRNGQSDRVAIWKRFRGILGLPN